MLKSLFSKRAPTSAEIEIPYFPASVELDGALLLCNGKGTRTRLTLQVYHAALYLPQPARSVQEVFEMAGPKQLRFVALRDISGGTLGAALLSGMRNNLSSEEVGRLNPEIGKVVRVFTSQDKVQAGQSFRIDLLPQAGAIFFIADEPKAEPVRAAGFNEAVLRVWLGANASDDALKAQLLGGGDNAG